MADTHSRRLTVRQYSTVSRVIWYFVVDGKLQLLPDKTGADVTVTQAGTRRNYNLLLIFEIEHFSVFYFYF